MKLTNITILALTAAVSAQQYPPLNVAYPNDCENGQGCSGGACCDFVNEDTNQQVKRCMTNDQMQGGSNGIFVEEFFDFTWTCPVQQAAEGAAGLKAITIATIAVAASMMF